jgi:archaeal cell division control protein 6
MSNIFRQLSSEQSIFKDEKFLRPEYLPEEMPAREREMKEMASYLQDAAKGRVPASMLITGRPGTGKTSMAKTLIKQLSEISRKPKGVYINCWENSTRYGILNKLVIEMGDMLPRRGIAADEIVLRLEEIGRRKENILIIILDEVDRLIATDSGEQKVLYDLSRAQDALGLDASVIAITNDEELPIRLDDRVRSSLTNHTINFKPYGPNQLKSILEQRAKKAFWPQSYDEDVIGLCAAIGSKAGGDARLTIHLLWAAAKKAESMDSKKVSVEHVKMVKESSYSVAATPAQRKSENLDELDKRLLKVIREANQDIDSGELYSKLKVTENEQRNIRNRLERLKNAGLIDSKDINKGSGRTRVWKIVNTAHRGD